MRYVWFGGVAAAIGVVIVVVDLMHGANIWRRSSGVGFVVLGLLLVRHGLAKR